MKRFVTEQITTIPAGTMVGLSPEQIRRRSHLVTVLDGEKAGEDGELRCIVQKKVQFKVGEVIYLEEGLPKHVIAGLIDTSEGEFTEASDDASDSELDEPSIPDDIEDVKAELDRLGVDRTGVRKHDELRELLLDFLEELD